jgi:lipopolysaccharide biosynthesis glycosyltransferase
VSVPTQNRRVDTPIVIAAAIDAGYVVPLRVMLTSLTAHLPPESRVVLHLVHTGLSTADLSQINEIIETHVVSPTAAQLVGAARSSRFPPEAGFALLLADLLPRELDRVLFLDADLFIRSDITPLWRTPLGSCIVGAAVDEAVVTCGSPRGVKHCGARGIPSSAPYFNGGLLLIDLDGWRARDVTSLARDYLRETGHAVDFLHQEALNAVLWQQWLPLDQRWNSLAGSRRGDAWIVHFAGRIKPWRTLTGDPHGGAYHDALAALGDTERGSVRDALMGVYDRYLRGFMYPLEHWLWDRRLL